MTVELMKIYIKLIVGFRNGWEMVRTLRGGPPCEVAKLWDGTILKHPSKQDGLVDALVELWINQAYTKDDFYQPSDDDVIIDAGANIGLFSILLARMNAKCRIIALEPMAENFACLQQNVQQVGENSIKMYRLALGGKSGRGRMVMGGERSLDYTLATGLSDKARDDDVVEIITLEETFQLAGASRISLLKLDIEGAEYDVFSQANSADLAKIDKIALEYHDHIKPGTLKLINDRLNGTHRLMDFPSSLRGCGVILGTRYN